MTPAESHIRDGICTDPREIRPYHWLLSISTSGLTRRTTVFSSLSEPKTFASPSPSLSGFHQTFIRPSLADSRICLTPSDFSVRFDEYFRALCCLLLLVSSRGFLRCKHNTQVKFLLLTSYTYFTLTRFLGNDVLLHNTWYASGFIIESTT
jgi:hypothetical protein